MNLDLFGSSERNREKVCVCRIPSRILCHLCISRSLQAGWPSVNAVYDLATRMKKARKEPGDDSSTPWISLELKRFLPDCFPEYVVTKL